MAEDEVLYAGGPAYVETVEDLNRFLAGFKRMRKVPVVKSGRGNTTEPHDRWHTAYISAPKYQWAIAFPQAGSSWSETTRSSTPTPMMACSLRFGAGHRDLHGPPGRTIADLKDVVGGNGYLSDDVYI
jgi:hypothetical protein